MKARGKINYAFTAALVLLCLVMVSVSLGAGLFARYATKDGASDNARVAGFNVRASHDSADVLIYEDKEYFDEWFISNDEELVIYPSEKEDKVYTMIVTTKQADGTHSRYTGDIDGWSYDSTRQLYTRTIDQDKAHSGTPVIFRADGRDCHIRLTVDEKNYRYIVKVFDQSEVAVKTDIVVRFKTSDVKEISGVKPVIKEGTIKLDGKDPDSDEVVLVGNVSYTDFTFKDTDKFSANPDEYSSAAPDSTTDELNYHVLTFEANENYKHKGIGYSGEKLQTKMIRWKVPDEPFDRTVTVTLADVNYKGPYSPSGVSYPNKFYPARDGGGDLIPGSYTLVVESGTVTLGSLPANTTCTYFNGTNIVKATESTPFSAGVYTLHLTSQTAVDYDSFNKAPELSPPVEATSWLDTETPEKYDPVKGVYTFTLPAGQKAHLNLPYGTVIKTYKWTPVESSVIAPSDGGKITLTNNNVTGKTGKRSYTLTGDNDVELKEPKDDGGNSIVDDWDDSRKDDGTYIFNTPKGKTLKFEGLPAAQKYSYVSYVEGVKGEGDSFPIPRAAYARTITLRATPIDGQKLKINGDEVDPDGGLYTFTVPKNTEFKIENLKSGERYYYSAKAEKVPVAQYTDESGKTRGKLEIPAPVADGYMELTFEHISLKDAAHVASGGIPYTAITGGDGTYTFDLKKGERVTFDDLPDGYTYNYTVVETVPSEEYPFSVARSLDDGLDYDNNVISVGKTGVEFTVSVRFTQID